MNDSNKAIIIEKFWERFGQYRRILLFGNTGGAVAALSFLGASFTADSAEPLLSSMFWCLVFFVTGIFMGLVDRVAEMFELHQRAQLPDHYAGCAAGDLPRDSGDDFETYIEKNTNPEALKSAQKARFLYRIQTIASSLASLFLIGASTWGLVILWRLTSD